MRIVTPFVAAGLLLVAAGRANHAQQPQQPPVPPQFRAAINFVEVDASVLDRTRRPIRGLAPVNFQVLEDGKPQEILAFSEIDVPDPPEVSTPWLRDVPPDVKTNILASDRRLIVLVLEDGIVGMDLHAKRVKEIGKRIVDKLGPGDLMAVMFTRDIKKSRDFTADRSKLLAAIDGYATGYSGTSGARNAIEQFVNLAKVFADVPQRRKTLIYVSSGWALEPFNPDHAFYRLRLEDAFEKAQRANVNIYTIDPVGLSDDTVAGSEGPPTSDATMRLSPSMQTLSGDPGSLAVPQTLAREFLLTVANNTGGLAVINNNDFNPGITQIFRENSSYYLLGYRSPNDKLDGKFRKIDVRVNVPGATVRARVGYFGPRPASGTPPSPLAKAISGLLPTSEIGMQIGVAPFAIPGRDETALALTLAVRQAMPPDRATLNENVGLLISAFGTLGERRASQGLQANLSLQRTNDEWVRYEVVSQMNLKPGRYQLRFATSSALQGRTGSIYYEVDVPDFRKPALSLSGVVMNVVPNVPSAPRGGLPNLLPIVPTTRRDFWEHDKVTAFLRIYQGGRQPAAAQLSTRIVDALGATVLELNDRIPAERFSVTRSADYYFELPTARLAPGPHLLTFEATLPGPKPVIARRGIRFTRRTK